MDEKEFTLLDRQECLDSSYGEAISKGYDCFQLKADGIWAKLILTGNSCACYSRTNKLKDCFELTLPFSAILLGEHISGSNWAQNPERKGMIYLFDIVEYNGNDLRSWSFEKRYKLLSQLCYDNLPLNKFSFLIAYQMNSRDLIWDSKVLNGDWEGIVYRKTKDFFTSKCLREKATFTKDYFITGFIEGEGRLAGSLGSLELSLFGADGNPLVCLSVGGGLTDLLRSKIWLNQGKYLNQVVEIRGNRLFETGALRHPNFVRFREDKSINECKLNMM